MDPLPTFGWTTVFTQARLELVPTCLLVLAGGFYWLGVRRLSARGDRWPVGRSIGYGAGHYDYTFAHLRKSKAVTGIGVAFAVQEIEAVPALSHDVALDYVLTEKKVFDFRS